MIQKITRATIALAICLLLAYGVGTAVSHSCSTVISNCTPSGVSAPLMPVIYTHCQASTSNYIDSHRSAVEGAGSELSDLKESAACCSANPCTSIEFTAHPGQLPTSSPWLQEAGCSFSSDRDSDASAAILNLHTLCHPTIPIFLLTKSIIC